MARVRKIARTQIDFILIIIICWVLLVLDQLKDVSYFSGDVSFKLKIVRLFPSSHFFNVLNPNKSSVEIIEV